MTIDKNLDQNVMPDIIYKTSKEGILEPYIEVTSIESGIKTLVPVSIPDNTK